jgi:hypothetical protein
MNMNVNNLIKYKDASNILTQVIGINIAEINKVIKTTTRILIFRLNVIDNVLASTS